MAMHFVFNVFVRTKMQNTSRINTLCNPLMLVWIDDVARV